MCCCAASALADDSEHFGAMGVAAFRHKNYNQAIGDFNKAIEVNTNYVGAYFYRGLSYLAMTQYDSAVADMNRALALNTNDSDAYYFRGLCYLDQGQYEKTIADMDSAISIKTNALYLTWRAFTYLQMTNYNGAIEDYTLILHHQPWNTDAYLNRARAYRLEKVFGLAMMDCDFAIKINPNLPEAYREQGEVFVGEGDLPDAIIAYGESIRLAPNESSSYYLKAMALSDLGDFLNAAASLTTFIKFNPESSEAYCCRGWCRSETGDYAGALSDCQRAIALDPKSMWGYNNLAWLMAVCPDSQFRNGKKALEYARKACALGGWQEGSCIDTLAAAYAENGDFRQAVKYEKRALKNIPPQNQAESYQALHCYEKGLPYRESLKPMRPPVNVSVRPPATPHQ